MSEQIQPNFGHLTTPWDSTGGVPWEAAFTLAQISNAVYDGDTIERRCVEWGAGKPHVLRDGTMFACVAANDDVVVVAFRGTDDLRDWLVNLDFDQKRVDDGLIHQGFYQAMRGMLDEIMELVRPQVEAGRRIWVTGHSLGGALTVALAYELVKLELFPDGVVSFGQPMTADGRLGNFLQSQLGETYARFVHGRDIVTRVVPPHAHFGRRIWIHDGELEIGGPQIRYSMAGSDDDTVEAEVVDDTPDELRPLTTDEFWDLQRQLRDGSDPSTEDTHAALFGGILSPITDLKRDHSMDNYVEAIRAFAEVR